MSIDTTQIRLVNFTPKPLQTVKFAYDLMKMSAVQTDLDQIDLKESEDITRKIINDDLATPLEFVSTVWFLGGVSRAFQQQLTRHRTFGFSIQSMRVVERSNFADEGRYHIPDDCKDPERYTFAMSKVQDYYRALIQNGEPVQVARGILPLNIHSPISMVANMRGLRHMFKQRMCRQVQGEFKDVVEAMIMRISEQIHPVFVEDLREPCRMDGRCMMSAENEIRRAGQDTLGRAPCELYQAVRR